MSLTSKAAKRKFGPTCGEESHPARLTDEDKSSARAARAVAAADYLKDRGPPPGLKWVRVRGDRPSVGREIKNASLFEELQRGKMDFTLDQLYNLELGDLKHSDYILVDTHIFKPAPSISSPTLDVCLTDGGIEFLHQTFFPSVQVDANGAEAQVSSLSDPTQELTVNRVRSSAMIEEISYKPDDGLTLFFMGELDKVMKSAEPEDGPQFEHLQEKLAQMLKGDDKKNGISEISITYELPMLVRRPKGHVSDFIRPTVEKDTTTGLSIVKDLLGSCGAGDHIGQVFECNLNGEAMVNEGKLTLAFREAQLKFIVKRVAGSSFGIFQVEWETGVESMIASLPCDAACKLFEPHTWQMRELRQAYTDAEVLWIEPVHVSYLRQALNAVGQFGSYDDTECAKLFEQYLGSSFRSGKACDDFNGKWVDDRGQGKCDPGGRRLRQACDHMFSRLGGLANEQYLKEIVDAFGSAFFATPRLFEKVLGEYLRKNPLGKDEDPPDAREHWTSLDEDECCERVVSDAMQVLTAQPLGLKKCFERSRGTIQKLQDLQSDTLFERKLDRQVWLVPWIDGVLDLRFSNCFRDCSPKDHITMSLPHNFRRDVLPFLDCMADHCTPEQRSLKEQLVKMLRQIWPQTEDDGDDAQEFMVYEFVMSRLSLMLCGDQNYTGHNFLLHYGRTRNGKSFMLKLLLFVFGDKDEGGFFASPNFSILTTPDKANAPAPDNLEVDRARAVCIDEGSAEGGRMQVAKVKKFTGGAPKDKAAPKHEAPRPVHHDAAGWHVFLNDPKTLLAEARDDPALSEERLICIPYEAYFAATEQKKATALERGEQYVFEADKSVDSAEWRTKNAPIFLALLLDIWQKYYTPSGTKWPKPPAYLESVKRNLLDQDGPLEEFALHNYKFCSCETHDGEEWRAGDAASNQWKLSACTHGVTDETIRADLPGYINVMYKHKERGNEMLSSVVKRTLACSYFAGRIPVCVAEKKKMPRSRGFYPRLVKKNLSGESQTNLAAQLGGVKTTGFFF